MAIFDVNGNELAAAYDVDGNALDAAYDVGGTEIFHGGKYPIDNVQSYFREPTLTVRNDLNSLSGDWQNIVFITDTHGSGNKQHSQAIGLYLLDNAPVSMLVIGGDYSLDPWSKTEYDTYMEPFLLSDSMDKIYAIFGNHETHGGGTAEAKGSIYNDFLRDKAWLSGVLENNYYYFDDSDRKIRYMFLNTSDYRQYEMSADQLSWIAQNAVLPSADWSLVVFGHVTLNDMGVQTYLNEANGADVVTAINNCNGSIIGYICGHQHIDAIYNDGNFTHVTLQCDKFENTNYYDGISVTDRVVGTVSEQAVSVISINTTTKDVVIRRIGAGRNQTLSYNYAESTENNNR